MDCPKCKSSCHIKDGIVQGRQRFKCKECLFRYTVERKSDVKTVDTKRLALDMYLEGLGFRSIGRVLKISYGTVYTWVKDWGAKVSLPRRESPVAIVELDEMHTYVGKKKNYCWIWIAVDRFGKRYFDFVCGDRSTATGLKLWEKIKGVDISCFCSDDWKSYKEFIPSDKHICTKAETFTVEGYNCRIRHYLARFKRKGLCYSKAVHIIEKSLTLLFLKLNNEITIRI